MHADVLPAIAYPFVPPPPPIVAPPRNSGVHSEYVGKSQDFNRLAIQGALLEFVTFGFYRFWLATKLRRHLWSSTLIEGEPFEYTGTAKELFVGFLFALAILVPIYFAYFLLGVEAERQNAFASTPLVLFLYAFGQFAIYRARRYRLTRTIWRGVRFWMDGSGLGYAWRACLWGFLVFLTMGLALPWREAALERYKMRHTYYGDLQGDFAGTGWQFFKRGWWLWLLVWLPFVILVGVGIVAGAGIASINHGGKPTQEQIGVVVLVYLLLSLVIVPILPFLYAAFKATEWRWWASGLRFGKLSVTSNLSRGALFGNYWATIGWSVLIFMIFFGGIIVVVVVLARLGLPIEGKKHSVDAMQAIAQGSPLGIALLSSYFAGYFATILAIGAAARVCLMRGVWLKVTASLSITGLAAADAVTARGEAANALGEGFADSLDIAGF
ncbi:MAG: DUF898 family protein [Beijerinckiaceae bacterium]